MVQRPTSNLDEQGANSFDSGLEKMQSASAGLFPFFAQHDMSPFARFDFWRRRYLICLVGRIVKHGRAEAVFALFAHQNIVIDATFATGPESIVVGEFGVGDGFVAEFGVDFHDRQARGESKNLGLWVFGATEVKNAAFDEFGHTAFAEMRRNDEA